MLTQFPIDSIILKNKKSKLLFNKLLKAAMDKATDAEMIEIINNHKPVSANQPFDIARILKMLHGKMNDTLLLVKGYAYESEMINNIGVALTSYLKEFVGSKDRMEDELNIISWKTDKKLIISEKKKSNKKGKR